MDIRIEALSEKNFPDFESLTGRQAHGGCYCSFWHQKWTNMADWEKSQKETPERNKAIMWEKMRSGFHLGVLAYADGKLLAWVSVGPLTDFYWTWKRTARLGEASKTTAAITCFTIADGCRGQGLQAKVLEALKGYGRGLGWKVIEGYPFDACAVEKHKKDVVWCGLTKGFEAAGFTRAEPHWLSSENAKRSIYRFEL